MATGNASLKEKALAAVAGVVVLYAVAAVIWFVSAGAAWKKAARNYATAKQKYADAVRVIGEKTKWTEEYESLRATMPTFVVGKATDTTWMDKMERLAEKNRVFISRRQGGAEIAKDDVLELPIEVGAWEASLEALVKFMHELETSDEGMFDISKLSMRSSKKKGYLSGSYTLNCAYMREKE